MMAWPFTRRFSRWFCRFLSNKIASAWTVNMTLSSENFRFNIKTRQISKKKIQYTTTRKHKIIQWLQSRRYDFYWLLDAVDASYQRSQALCFFFTKKKTTFRVDVSVVGLMTHSVHKISVCFLSQYTRQHCRRCFRSACQWLRCCHDKPFDWKIEGNIATMVFFIDVLFIYWICFVLNDFFCAFDSPEWLRIKDLNKTAAYWATHIHVFKILLSSSWHYNRFACASLRGKTNFDGLQNE